jgi:sulfide:quinone oxidoreductase
MRVLVLGAGFGGLELTTSLSEQFGDQAEVVLIDQSDDFVFGFSKLDVMFGRIPPAAVRHPYRDLIKPGVRFVQATVTAIDPAAKRAETDAGVFEADVLVVALGADLDPQATPGLLDWGHDFYTEDAAFALQDVLERFAGGRVVVGVMSTPFKCPPAPSETALLMHDYLMRRGLRENSEISLVMPLPVPIPPSPAASEALLAAFGERGIGWYPNRLVKELAEGVAVLADDTEMPFDLFLGVPAHRVPHVVADSGMTVDGWIPVDPLTLETAYPQVFAVGDVASVGTPKAGASPPSSGVTAALPSTTGAACATSNSATTRSPGSASRSPPGKRHRGHTRHPLLLSQQTRASSDLAASSGGSVENGRAMDSKRSIQSRPVSTLRPATVAL